MTVRELKDFIKDCNDTDFVTICSCKDDNPISFKNVSREYLLNHNHIGNLTN